MKKIFSTVLLSVLVISSMTLSSCKKDETSDQIRMVGFYVTPASSIVEIGDSQELTVWASYSDGSKVNMTDSVQVTSSDPTVARFENGIAYGVKEGKVTLTATYKDKSDTCSFVVSPIVEIKLSISGSSKKLLAFPKDKYEAEDIEVKAVYKTGDSKNIAPDTLISANPRIAEFKWEKDTLKGLNIAAITNDTTKVSAYYKTVSGDIKEAELHVIVANLDAVSFSLEASVWDEANKKFKYEKDTLKLGTESYIVAAVIFSWQGTTEKDTVEVLTYCDSLASENPAVLGIVDDESVVANDTTVKGKPIYFTGKFFGKTYTSRPIVIVKDASYKKVTYEVGAYADYAYVGDVIQYWFVQRYDNGVSIDLTNNRNPEVQSALVKGEMSDTTWAISSGVLQVRNRYYSEDMNEKDTLKVCVEYNGIKTLSGGIVLYDQPALGFNFWRDTIYINSRSRHLYNGKDDVCSIVDNAGRDWSESITKNSRGYYCLPIADEMRGRTLVLTYGPEKRTASLYVPGEE